MTGKGQFSFEFLTTYGWMLMVTLIVGGSLAYYGVFDLEQNLPQSCDFGFDFLCSKYTAFSNGTVRVALQNGVGVPLRVVGFSCDYPDGSSASMASLPAVDWLQGEVVNLSCNPVPSLSFNPGDRLEVDVSLVYRKSSGGFASTVPGVIKVNAVSSS